MEASFLHCIWQEVSHATHAAAQGSRNRPNAYFRDSWRDFRLRSLRSPPRSPGAVVSLVLRVKVLNGTGHKKGMGPDFP